jgi:phosphoribosyl 1,2-cyclic phosphate phosphodiesterase
LRITILGTGTSQGVPIIGCNCPTCTSKDVRDNRLRSSIHIEKDGNNILIDIGPDFRQQMLTNKLTSVDCILLTHEHNDHVVGIDDIRPINFLHAKSIPLYGLARVVNDVTRRFDYAFQANSYPGVPRIDTYQVQPFQSIFLNDKCQIQCLPIWHGNLEILSYRVDNFAYVCDVSQIDEKTIEHLQNLDILIISALRFKPHPTHCTLDEALELINLINPKQAYLTHMSHEIGLHSSLLSKLPKNIVPGFDGLILEC